MPKILGFDLGTNSIGWALRDTQLQAAEQLTHYGSLIFSKGVGEGKSGEFSLAAERTAKRNLRKSYRRRKLRKHQVLKVLIEHRMCPLSMDELFAWTKYRKGHAKVYPSSVDFANWIALNPLELGSEGLDEHRTLNLMELGRVFYFLCQRRGFKSNRLEWNEKDLPKDEERQLAFKKKYPDKTIIEVRYEKWLQGERFRGISQSKEEGDATDNSRILYEEFFDLFCGSQAIREDLKAQLYQVIFYQRPLKSQRHAIGKCTLEKDTNRSPISAISFELFRMYQVLNNITYRPQGSNDAKIPLDDSLKTAIMPKFFRKSKATFPFKEIAKEINKVLKDKRLTFEFNYHPDQTISGCPTLSQLNAFFEEGWSEIAIPHTRRNGSQGVLTAEHIWHVWFDYEDKALLKEFALNKLGFDDAKATKFAQVQLPQGYASLSRKAIDKILVFLKQGLPYDKAVLMANIPMVIGQDNWKVGAATIAAEINKLFENHKQLKTINEAVNGAIAHFNENYSNGHAGYVLDQKDEEELEAILIRKFGANTWAELSEAHKVNIINQAKALYQKQLRLGVKGKFVRTLTLEQQLKEFLIGNFDVDEAQLDKLYHPSAIDLFEKVQPNKKNQLRLDSPRTNSIRNPMAMRMLFQLRQLVNSLLAQDIIDENTKIVIELARELNDSNRRAAIKRWQKTQEKERNDAKKSILEYCNQQQIPEPKHIEELIQRYRLMEEQKWQCFYTGQAISIADVVNTQDRSFDVEHTIPRSRSFDNSRANLTLAATNFNNQKENKTPYELSQSRPDLINMDEVKARLDSAFAEKIKNKRKIIAKNKRGGGYESVETKNQRIQRKHLAQLELDYMLNKCNRILTKEVKDSFKNSQLIDTSIITKYARAYLQSLFRSVYSVKGSIVAEYRKLIGIQSGAIAKNRGNHTHHTIDAIVATCLTPTNYQLLAKYYQQRDTTNNAATLRLSETLKPWADFETDIKALQENILIRHQSNDNTFKQTKKKERQHGKIVKLNDKPIYQKGKGVRASLHNDSFYGAIKVAETSGTQKLRDSEGKHILKKDKQGNDVIRYVRRVKIADLTAANVKNIVDIRIRTLIEKIGLDKAQKDGLFLPPSKGKTIATPVKKVRVYQKVSNPIVLKEQSHKRKGTPQEHKEWYYVTNESNYELLFFEKASDKGIKREVQAVNFMEATKRYLKADEPAITEFKNLPLKYQLRKGTMVLFYEQHADEIKWDDDKDLSLRLYRISEIFGDGRIKLRWHQDARNDEQIKLDVINQRGDEWLKANKTFVSGKSSFQLNEKYPKLHLSKSNLNFLVEKQDFKFSINGIITRIE